MEERPAVMGADADVDPIVRGVLMSLPERFRKQSLACGCEFPK